MMKALIIILLFSLKGFSQEIVFEKKPLAPAEYILTMAVPLIVYEMYTMSDVDKKKHFAAGYLTNATASYIIRKNTDNVVIQIVGGLLSGYLVTYAKEAADLYLGTGVYSKADINAGGWGSNMAMFSYAWAIREKPVKVIKEK